MLKKYFLGFAFIFLFFACEKNSTNPVEELTFDERLYALPDLEINEITPQNGFPWQFEIYINQSLDHNNPAGTKFRQQIFLSHRDEAAPVVFMPSGYNARARTVVEITELLNANQIYVAHDIATVPDTGQTVQQLYQLIKSWGTLPYYSDEYIDFYEPVYYQLYTELGYYRLVDDHLSHLLVDLPDPSYSYFAPKGVPLNFNPATMQDIHNWLQSEGNNIIYIYGGIDPGLQVQWN